MRVKTERKRAKGGLIFISWIKEALGMRIILTLSFLNRGLHLQENQKNPYTKGEWVKMVAYFGTNRNQKEVAQEHLTTKVRK